MIVLLVVCHSQRSPCVSMSQCSSSKQKQPAMHILYKICTTHSTVQYSTAQHSTQPNPAAPKREQHFTSININKSIPILSKSNLHTTLSRASLRIENVSIHPSNKISMSQRESPPHSTAHHIINHHPYHSLLNNHSLTYLPTNLLYYPIYSSA